jgi:hypothetical protein
MRVQRGVSNLLGSDHFFVKRKHTYASYMMSINGSMSVLLKRMVEQSFSFLLGTGRRWRTKSGVPHEPSMQSHVLMPNNFVALVDRQTDVMNLKQRWRFETQS